MKKRIRTAIIILSVILVLCLSVVLGGFIRIKVMESRLHPVTQPFSEMEQVPICVDRVFLLDDTEKCIGFSDNVFIGTVSEILGTRYNNLKLRNFRLVDYEGPETVYKIKVHRNIKGNAPGEITLVSYSGQNPDGTLTLIDPLAEDKTTYVFMCCEIDGEYRMINCNYLGDNTWYETSDNVSRIISQYEEAFKNQDLSVRHD